MNFGKPVLGPPPTITLAAIPRVNVTLRTQGQIRGSMSGIGNTFLDQLNSAVDRASVDRRFTGAVVDADIESVSIEVWLQLSAEEIPLALREDPLAIRMGEDGLELQLGSAFAYYKPSVALTGGFDTPQDLFSALSRKAKLSRDSWRDTACNLRRTTWIHFAEDSERRSVELHALRPIRRTGSAGESFSRETMVAWAQDGARYLAFNQYSDGGFCYLYNPLNNTASREPTNSVRASGCAYAIAMAASSPDLPLRREFVNAAERAASAIYARGKQLGNGGVFIPEATSDDQPVDGKLGTTALLLAAMLCPILRDTHAEEVEALMLSVKSTQNHNGLFECAFTKQTGSDTQANFFPGQALLTFVTKAALGDDSCRKHYRSAFKAYRDHFRQGPTTAFVGWHADVWSRAAILDSNSEYADFVFEQIDWILQYQIQSAGLATGGYRRAGKQANCSSIVYTEAVARAASLARHWGDAPRWNRYRTALIAGLGFCAQLRLVEEQSIFFPRPARALGGVVRSLSSFEVRSDNVQHLVTLALAVLDEPAFF